jgi:GNAT superfamily N-acetyltransferase
MTASLEIRAFRRSTDLAAAAELWTAALASGWPVLPDGLELLWQGYVAERDGRCIGLIAVAVDDDPRPGDGHGGGGPVGGGRGDTSTAGRTGAGGTSGSIRFLAVAPDERRQGIATRLVEHALGDLRRMGVTRVAFGSGAGPYIWPGVPLDRPDALAFFDALGWEETYVATDLTADLQATGLDEQLAGFAPPEGVALAVAGPEQRAQVLEFEDRYFPEWSRWFRDPSKDPLLAYDEAGALVGSLLLAGPGHATLYWPLLGEDSAEIACVGVAPAQENRGVGSAMVARASQVLRQRHAGVCHIGWAVRVGFYSRIGYTPWRRYSMRARTL